MKTIASLLDLHMLIGIGTKLHFRFMTRGYANEATGPRHVENLFLDVSTV
jgi:hypothetical protein